MSKIARIEEKSEKEQYKITNWSDYVYSGETDPPVPVKLTHPWS